MIVEQYFSNIYTSYGPSDLQSLTEGLPCKVTNDMNAKLTLPFCAAEIKQAVFSMYPLKAPGEDSLTALFFQKYWDVIGHETSSAIWHFFEGGRMLPNANHTIFSLIPQGKQVSCIGDLWPIGLCNVFYKIIAKVLVNRLRPFMDLIVDVEQNAFIQDQSWGYA